MKSLQLFNQADMPADDLDEADDPVSLGVAPNIGRILRIALIAVACFAGIFVLVGVPSRH